MSEDFINGFQIGIYPEIGYIYIKIDGDFFFRFVCPPEQSQLNRLTNLKTMSSVSDKPETEESHFRPRSALNMI